MIFLSLSISPYPRNYLPPEPPQQPAKHTQQNKQHSKRNPSPVPAPRLSSCPDHQLKSILHDKTYIAGTVEGLAAELDGAEVDVVGREEIILPEVGDERLKVGRGGEA